MAERNDPWAPHERPWSAQATEWMRKHAGSGSMSQVWERGPLVGCCEFEGYFEAASRAYGEVFGWSIAELRSVPWWEFVHPDERDDLVEGVELMMHVGSWDGAKARFLGRDGYYRHTRWSFLADHAEQVIYCAGWEQGDRQKSGQVAVGVWQQHRDGDAMTWSGGLFAPVSDGPGTPPQTYKEFLELVDTIDRTQFAQRMQASLATGDPISETLRVARPAGLARIQFAGTVAPGMHADPRARGIAQTLPQDADASC